MDMQLILGAFVGYLVGSHGGVSGILGNQQAAPAPTVVTVPAAATTPAPQGQTSIEDVLNNPQFQAWFASLPEATQIAFIQAAMQLASK